MDGDNFEFVDVLLLFWDGGIIIVGMYFGFFVFFDGIFSLGKVDLFLAGYDVNDELNWYLEGGD